jgi:hypothetical protein
VHRPRQTAPARACALRAFEPRIVDAIAQNVQRMPGS